MLINNNLTPYLEAASATLNKNRGGNSSILE